MSSAFELDKGQRLLQQLVHFRTYAATKSDGYKETVTESIMRTEQMHLDKFPSLTDNINKAFDQVYAGKVVPSMRALDDETLIPTEYGFKKIKDICIGDYLFDRQGNHTLVKNVLKFTDIPLYEVTFSDGSVINSCDEHLWIVKTNDDLKNHKPERLLNTLQIKKHLRQGTKLNIRIKNSLPINYKHKELIVDPYVLGVWLGDGYSSGNQWSAHPDDAREWMCKIYETAGYMVREAGTKNIYAWNVAGLKKDLSIYNLINNKHIPEIYLISSAQQRYDLLAGLIDTDDCVDLTGRFTFSNTNSKLIEGIEHLISSLGFTYTKTKKEAHDNNKEAWAISFFGNSQCTRMLRKKTRVIARTHLRTKYRRVTSVEYIKNGNATCFEVDSFDQSFVVGKRYIPTHNCLQFSGTAILKENIRAFNCSAHPVTSLKTIADFFYISMCGAGIGYSVQQMHIKDLPKIAYGQSDETFAIPDSKEGWSDSLLKLLENPRIQFDYTLIRPSGMKLSSGGTASGPIALQTMHGRVRLILLKASERKLRSIEIHDIICHMLDAVVVGGSRRSSAIVLFDATDEEMLTSKTGNWFDSNPQRARANNSAVLYRDDPKLKQKFDLVFDRMVQSGYGEPGFLLSNSRDLLVNPCNEARLLSFCNLSEINVAACKTPTEFMEAVHAATVIGSLQAAYTNFNYIAPDWKEKCEHEALLGVSLTGQALNWELLTKDELLRTGAESLLSTNLEMAQKLGINPAHRIGLVKPSGTTSAWLGVTSGIHAAYSPYYFRRVRIDVSHPIAQYLLSIYKLNVPDSRSFLEYDKFNSSNVIVTIPMKSSNTAIQREKETAIELLERDKFVYNNWIKASHRTGEDTHNISITVDYRPEELEGIRKWMWENRENYAGISLFPRNDNKYSQTPFESVSKSTYYRKYSEIADLDFSLLNYENILDERLGEVACGGQGGCEFK
jgi:ribonucleoside-diphosphate reductase alpha chain